MATVEQIIKELSKYDPKESILVLWWDRKLAMSWVEDTLGDMQENYSLTDEKLNNLFDEAWESTTNGVYDSPDVGDQILECLNEYLEESEVVVDIEKDQELWEA
jgi:hypothetical protein